MVIVETPIFTRLLQSLLDDDEYRELQQHLIEHPESGKLIKGAGGLRKVRWMAPGRGKQGGVRTIYYWAKTRDIILLLFIYPKSERENLTPAQLQLLRRVVEEEYHE